MIKGKPEIGMRVTVDDPKCCCTLNINHRGAGVIIDIDGDDSFLVKMDDYPDEKLYRCRKCTTAIQFKPQELIVDAQHSIAMILAQLEKDVGYMKTALSSIASAFTLVSGVQCRASIKVIGQNADNELYTLTLARDRVSQVECKARDASENTQHLTAANTDFHLIMEHNLEYFFEGDLPNYPNYLNTSMNAHDGMAGQKWRLPYKSTIVWPIRYVFTKNERKQNAESTQEDIYGFLTIDSSSTNAFIERYDVQMGATLADALFPILDAYYKFKA